LHIGAPGGKEAEVRHARHHPRGTSSGRSMDCGEWKRLQWWARSS